MQRQQEFETRQNGPNAWSHQTSMSIELPMIERAKCDKVLLMEKKRQEDFQTGRYKFLVEFAVQPGTQQSAIH